MSGERRVYRQGLRELRQARRAAAGLFAFAAMASVVVNLLMLTGPLFMLQVYDRVLGSRSEETLLALGVLVAFLFAMMAVLDWARGRVMARAGARFQATMDARVFDAVLRGALRSGARNRPAQEMADLQAIRQFMVSPLVLALFDMPFAPLFGVLIFAFHPLLGWMAVVGGALLIALSLVNQLLTRRRQIEAVAAETRAESFAAEARAEAEAVIGMGMQRAVLERWRRMRTEALRDAIAATDRTGVMAAASKSYRLFLQSAMLGVGAWLVLRNQISPGAMVAASILLGRALAPIELSLVNWPLAQRALSGWRSLSRILEENPPSRPRTTLPEPRAHLKIRGLSVVPPGEARPALNAVSFEVKPGQAVGVIGPSAAGKSTLARAITGVWPVSAGRVELDGASIEQYDPATLGRHVGYLPQSITLFRGTIAENIARMATDPDHAAVVRAAQAAGAHETIKALPQGYDTLISNDARLSGGQRQLVGLARALYGDPKILVLDEPNSNLDSFGGARLNAAIRALKARGGAVLIIAHRPAAIAECEMLLVLDAGRQKAFGPRDEVLKAHVRNVAQIRPVIGKGAGG